ncbi:MAG: protein kinase domain-containing protein [Pseudonocardia sp.]
MSTPENGRQRRNGGRYRLGSQLGAGAMGTVWSAFDEVLRRHVAVKELKVPPGVPEREALDMRERMLREARALGGLSHPNVITVFDVVDVDGEPMMVLEMVPSRNLATMIVEQGVLTGRQAAVVGFTTAAALRAAHRAGITHRDVKPANVLIADDGRVKLTDFGIARNSADTPMTVAGLVLGSPAYIAPEVAAGQPVTPAADLWGLGATLFTAIEGRPPYDVRGDPVSTITEVVDGEVPRPRGTGPVADVIAALMVKDPARRMSLEDVRHRLRPLVSDPDDPRYPGSPGSSALDALIDRPAEPGTNGPRAPEYAAGALSSVSAAPLAAAPGPLPWQANAPEHSDDRSSLRRSVAEPVRASGWAAVGIALAGAAVVLAGAASGWAGTRVLAGQSPLSTVTVTTARTELRDHVDPLGFTARVPLEWVQYRYEVVDGPTSVSFVSPDDGAELTVQRASSATAVTDGLTAELLGVDAVVSEPPAPLPDGSTQLVYRTEEGSWRRTSWVRLVPPESLSDEVWTVRLTVPGGRGEDTAAALFDVLTAAFVPTTA